MGFFEAISVIVGILVMLYLFTVCTCLFDVVFNRHPLLWALVYPINKSLADDILMDHINK